MQELRVELGERSYKIIIGKGILPDIGRALRGLNPSKVALISNPKVYGLYGDRVSDSLASEGIEHHKVIIPDGERYKSLLWADFIYGELLRARLDRASIIVALGGGVVGDISGFVASTYMRGIRFIQVPTTLLAQVDSSVGGKTGVNHLLGKNMIGTFYQPSLVWIDIETLKSLPKRELIAGLAEVIKYGVIWDRGFFEFLEAERVGILSVEDDPISHIIGRSCEIKSEVVSRDERESGLRAILNFGHTIGHAIETATGYGRYLHGEAVAIGMVYESRLSDMPKDEITKIEEVISSYGLPTKIPPEIEPKALLSSMEVDKKALSGVLRFVIPKAIGSVIVEGVDRDRILSVISDR